MVFFRDAHSIRFSYREPVQIPHQYTKIQSRKWRISWQNKWLFLQSLSFRLHNAHTYSIHTISQIHTPVIVSFALTTKKKIWKKKKKVITQNTHSTHF